MIEPEQDVVKSLLDHLGVKTIEQALRLVQQSPLPLGRPPSSSLPRSPPQFADVETYLSFRDLQAARIVKNWQTLRNWQRDPSINFPLGRLFGPNTRRWSLQREILPWLAARPINRTEDDRSDGATPPRRSRKPVSLQRVSKGSARDVPR